MQRKSIGHSRKKHGEHGASDLSRRWRAPPGNPGPVSSGDVLPNGTTTGVPSAAATCIGPVSFVSKTRQSFSNDISSRSEVWPDKLKFVDCGLRIADSICAVNGWSSLPPNRSQAQFVRCWISFAAAMYFSAGQRLAGPYSAPGFRPMISPLIFSSPNFFFAASVSSGVTVNCGASGLGSAPSAAVKLRYSKIWCAD